MMYRLSLIHIYTEVGKSCFSEFSTPWHFFLSTTWEIRDMDTQLELLTKKWDGILPVSYTHLDVYKRQGLSHSTFLICNCNYSSHVALLYTFLTSLII